MSEAFQVNIGPLTLLDAPIAEQKAARDLFTGAMGYFRNPLAHREVGIKESAQAASTILLANELMVTAIRHYMIRKDAATLPG